MCSHSVRLSLEKLPVKSHGLLFLFDYGTSFMTFKVIPPPQMIDCVQQDQQLMQLCGCEGKICTTLGFHFDLDLPDQTDAGYEAL